MNESFVHMACVSFDRACTQDGYLKQPHLTITDRDMRWDRGWIWRKQGKKTHPNYGGRHCPMAAMVPPPRHHHIQQLANMLCNKSMSLKLENIIVFTINLLAILRHNALLMRRA
jgi:hypothetical protein